MSCIATLVGGIAVSSGQSLNLEQVPANRGTMMSIIGVFGSAGVSIGSSVGALALASNGFQLLGLTLGMFGIVAATAIYFLAKDPCKENL
jgi:MFS family permease